MSFFRAISTWFKPALSKEIAKRTLGEFKFLAADLELTSLDASEAHITSIGWVEGRLNCIDISSCEYGVIRTRKPLGQSPVIHGLTNETVDDGESIEAYAKKLSALTLDYIWVFHNAALDLSVLDRAYQKLSLTPVTVVYFDTLQMALYELKKRHQVVPSNSASLSACIARANLPDFPAHNALDDAFSTLQLCYWQLSNLGAKPATQLNELLHTGAIKAVTLGKAS
ncbi:3'-5' exonuclease [Alteromonas sp. KUL49]|uniref:3'-5' exonuclease n=1 Tax=Alteromonas sp. KUL49 TaxID=2480798 RepID=UPI0010FFC743|nr:3'-5' exonuclease [Alteromonas sp. KUL49]GEA13663.1 hypothetical protein KUL49_40380 [Alteromonas sp. KUL49]